MLAIKELGGADAAIAVAVAPRAFEQAYRSLRRGGKLVFVALPADNSVQLPIFETVLNGITVLGSIVGTRTDLAEVFRLHALGRTRVVRETRNLDDVNECFAVGWGVESTEDLESQFADARARRFPSRPGGMSFSPTVLDPSQAPDGKHTAFTWQLTSYHLPWDEAKRGFDQAMPSALEDPALAIARAGWN